MLICSGPAAADAAIGSASSTDIGAAARGHLRVSRQHEARSLLAAYRFGQSVYDQMLVSLSMSEQMMARRGADKSTVGEISLLLGFSRTKAGTWFKPGDALQRLPKIRPAYLAAEYSTNRMAKMVYAAQAAPEGVAIVAAPEPASGEPDPTKAPTLMAMRQPLTLAWPTLIPQRPTLRMSISTTLPPGPSCSTPPISRSPS